jgi:hypothetical protein
MKKFDIIWSKYNVIPKICVNAVYEKHLKLIAKILWFCSFLLAMFSITDFVYTKNWRNIVAFVIFLLNSVIASIYSFRYQIHTQFYAICKECGEKIFIPLTNPPPILKLRCKNNHTFDYKKEELKSFEIGVAAGPTEKFYKSFRIYLD